jgi:hypothetical protein
MSNIPNGTWEQVDIDFYGPKPSNTDLLVINIVAMIGKKVTSKKAESVIPILHERGRKTATFYLFIIHLLFEFSNEKLNLKNRNLSTNSKILFQVY